MYEYINNNVLKFENKVTLFETLLGIKISIRSNDEKRLEELTRYDNFLILKNSLSEIRTTYFPIKFDALYIYQIPTSVIYVGIWNIKTLIDRIKQITGFEDETPFLLFYNVILKKFYFNSNIYIAEKYISINGVVQIGRAHV